MAQFLDRYSVAAAAFWNKVGTGENGSVTVAAFMRGADLCRATDPRLGPKQAASATVSSIEHDFNVDGMSPAAFDAITGNGLTIRAPGPGAEAVSARSAVASRTSLSGERQFTEEADTFLNKKAPPSKPPIWSPSPAAKEEAEKSRASSVRGHRHPLQAKRSLAQNVADNMSCPASLPMGG